MSIAFGRSILCFLKFTGFTSPTIWLLIYKRCILRPHIPYSVGNSLTYFLILLLTSDRLLLQKYRTQCHHVGALELHANGKPRLTLGMPHIDLDHQLDYVDLILYHSAAWYVGYAEDGESVEAIMKKFEELERMQQELAAQNGGPSSSTGPTPTENTATPPIAENSSMSTPMESSYVLADEGADAELAKNIAESEVNSSHFITLPVPHS